MTNPPQSSDERGEDDRTEVAGASRIDPDRFPTEPTPSVPPAAPSTGSDRTRPYTAPPSYGSGAAYPSPQYGPPSAEQRPPYPQSPPYGQPSSYPQTPPYGQPAVPPSYGQPGPAPYGQPAQAPYGGQPRQYGSPYGTPQYPGPAPQYGPPPGAPAQRSKVGLIAIATGVLLLVIAGVVGLVMSLQSKVLDPTAVERDVAAQFEQREGVAIELDCGDDMKVSEGATYTCEGRTADGEAVTLKIAITDADAAAYTWTEP